MEEKEIEKEIEKEMCFVCTETLNKISHKKINCCYCSFECCHRCTQRYILSHIQDPHCMNCKKAWSREFLDEKMSKTFINTELKFHRENILFEKEKNLLPETQENVKLILIQEDLDKQIKDTESKIEQLQRQMEELERKKRDINPYQVIRNQPIQMNRIPCPLNECRGFIEDLHLICGICSIRICQSCREPLIKTEAHSCNYENIKSILLLEKETKRCPNCCVQIFKINGCDQMWCTNCHIAFDWKTGENVHGVIHNPHYHSYIEEHGVIIPDITQRSYQRFEFISSEVISHALLKEECNELLLYQLIEVYRYMIHYYEVDLQRFPNRFDEMENIDLRILYLRNQLSEEDFKMKLQRRQKDTEKKMEYREIGETYVEIIKDLYISFLDAKDIPKLIDSIKMITKTTQDAISNLNKRYHSNLPLVRTLI